MFGYPPPPKKTPQEIEDMKVKAKEFLEKQLPHTRPFQAPLPKDSGRLQKIEDVKKSIERSKDKK